MKNMVNDLVNEVKAAKDRPKISAISEEEESHKKNTEGKKGNKTEIINSVCPKCKNGKLLKGKTSYGCSHWKKDCTFRLPFEFMEKKISENQLLRLLQKGSTVLLKGFKQNENKIDGIISFNEKFELVFKEEKPTRIVKEKSTNLLNCPKCKKGNIIKGKLAYGCSNWKNGCDFRFSFEELRKKANGKELTKELVLEIMTRN